MIWIAFFHYEWGGAIFTSFPVTWDIARHEEQGCSSRSWQIRHSRILSHPQAQECHMAIDHTTKAENECGFHGHI